MIPDGYIPPVRNTEDIPIERDSVPAMSMNTVARPFRAYEYGMSPLYLRPDIGYQVQRPDLAAEERAKRRKTHRKPKPRLPRPVTDRDQLVAYDAAREAQRMLDELDRPEPKPQPKKHKKRKDKKPKPRPTIPPLPRKPKPARPAPGWKPLTGEDLEDMWAMLEEG